MADIDSSELPLINESLGQIGAGSVYALDEETPLNNHVQKHWPPARDHCLAVHDWDFCFKTFKLGQDATYVSESNGWTYRHDYPGGVISGPRALLRNPRYAYDPIRKFSIEAGQIYSDYEEVWARFRVAPHPSLWAILFANAVKRLAAANLCVPVTHDEKLAKLIREEAIGRPEEKGKGGLLGLAIAEDLAQNPVGSPILRSDPLTQARYG